MRTCRTEPVAVTVEYTPEHPLPDPLTVLEILTDECARYAGENGTERLAAWPHRS